MLFTDGVEAHAKARRGALPPGQVAKVDQDLHRAVVGRRLFRGDEHIDLLPQRFLLPGDPVQVSGPGHRAGVGLRCAAAGLGLRLGAQAVLPDLGGAIEDVAHQASRRGRRLGGALRLAVALQDPGAQVWLLADDQTLEDGVLFLCGQAVEPGADLLLRGCLRPRRAGLRRG